MRIGDLSAATGASARSLRYYEQQGLLASERSSGGQRHYPESAVERVTLISEPYKLSSRQYHTADTVVKVGDAVFGGPEMVVIAGPCSVESRSRVTD